MKTQVLSVMVALTLSTLACGIASQPTGVVGVVSSSTPTATYTPSSTPTQTFTPTPIPPTRTPRPTYTATPRISEAIITADENVIIRAKPCYQGRLTVAEPGMKFRATGWFVAPQKEKEQWVRIEYRGQNGLLIEGWIRGDLVEVTNSDLIPRLYEPCPHTPTHTPELSKDVRDSYIRVYRHESFDGASLDIKITDCGLVDLDPNGRLNDAISSFDLFAPDNVKVVLVEHHSFDSRFPGKAVSWHGNNEHLKVNIDRFLAWGINDAVSSIAWFVDGKQVPGKCQR